MRNALSILFLVIALVAVGCGSGSSGGTAEFRIRCLGGEAFCIISCDLGCNQTGCAVTEIAENQRIRFKFSSEVDRSTVNASSISIRTATGVAPDGDFEVIGNEVTFVPNVRTVGGTSTFGFLRNESYIITLAGGDSIAQSVKNLAGDGLSQEFSCTVVASLGIRDEDGQPPTVELLSPADPNQTPTNPTIVLRFSELIDTTPLQVAIGDASPIRAVLRGVLPNGLCNADAEGITLTGIPQVSTEFVGEREVTTVTFQPSVTLPGNSCVTVRVTADLRDLSGQSAIPAKFDLFTVAGTPVQIERSESFDNDAGQVDISGGGTWSNGARPGVIGGDGRHGSFNHENGTPVGNGVWEIDTGGFPIPAGQTLTGIDYLVTNGRFFFSDFVVPSGVKVRFVGTAPPIISVRGNVQIEGEVLISGESMQDMLNDEAPMGQTWALIASAGLATGQLVSNVNAKAFVGAMPGTEGGVGAGRGGDGGVKGNNLGPVIVSGIPINDGQPGEDARVAAGHAYAGQVVGTGGKGSLMTPASGIWPGLPGSQLLGGLYVPYFSSGGGGGGFMTAGGVPNVMQVAVAGANPISETPAVPGVAFPLLPFPPSPLPDYESLDHYLVGGSGGGGGGSHGYGIFGIGGFDRWMAGHSGTGGGGTMAIRAGGDITIGLNGLLEARGGQGIMITGDDAGPLSPLADISNGVSSPGGGGSGGSFLIQAGGDITVAGTIDCGGAQGSVVANLATPQVNPLVTQGKAGDGSDGFFRMEALGNVQFGGTAVPALTVDSQGALTDRDDFSGDTSTWRTMDVIFPPTWQRYELDVDLDGDGSIDETYSDAGAGSTLAWEPDGPVLLPVRIEFQGSDIDPLTGAPAEGSLGQWRAGIGSNGAPGLNLDAVTAFRFNITYNRAMFPDMVVRGLRVYAEL